MCVRFTFEVMVGLAFVAALASMFLFDLMGREFSQHASTLGAPAMIIISFGQTVNAFLEADIPWPGFLREYAHHRLRCYGCLRCCGWMS